MDCKAATGNARWRRVCRAPRVAHAPQPAAIAGVKLRRDFSFEKLVDAVGIVAVLLRAGFECSPIADRPAVFSVERFWPPAVEDGAIDPAVQRRLHAAGAA